MIALGEVAPNCNRLALIGDTFNLLLPLLLPLRLRR